MKGYNENRNQFTVAVHSVQCYSELATCPAETLPLLPGRGCEGSSCENRSGGSDQLVENIQYSTSNSEYPTINNKHQYETTNINNKSDKLAAPTQGRDLRCASTRSSWPVATARLYRVVSKPGINKPHDRIVRQQGHLVSGIWYRVSVAPAQLHRVEIRTTSLVWGNTPLGAGGSAGLSRRENDECRMMMNDLRSIKTNEHPSERTNINDKQDKLAARGSRLAANIEYRITNKKYKSIYSRPAGIEFPVSSIGYRVSSIGHQVSESAGTSRGSAKIGRGEVNPACGNTKIARGRRKSSGDDKKSFGDSSVASVRAKNFPGTAQVLRGGQKIHRGTVNFAGESSMPVGTGQMTRGVAGMRDSENNRNPACTAPAQLHRVEIRTTSLVWGNTPLGGGG